MRWAVQAGVWQIIPQLAAGQGVRMTVQSIPQLIAGHGVCWRVGQAGVHTQEARRVGQKGVTGGVQTAWNTDGGWQASNGDRGSPGPAAGAAAMPGHWAIPIPASPAWIAPPK